MKSNKRRCIFLVLAIIWMIMIFGFSSRDGDLSGEDSGRVGRLVGEWFVPGFDEWSETKQSAFVDKVDFPIRKTAHATEYAILGILFLGAIYEVNQRKRYMIGIPWLLGTTYAGTDEFHQLFVPGRSGQIRDVMIDSCGVFAGVLIVACVINYKKKARKNMNELYEAIEKKIKDAGYPRKISGADVYNDICDQIDGKENGTYILLSKFEDDVVFEYHITIQDEDFNLGILTMKTPEGVFEADFDAE